MRRLHLDQLKKGQPGITESAGLFLSEASAFCLMKNGHTKGIELEVSGVKTENLRLYWSQVLDKQMQQTWEDGEEATEYGAMGIAVLLVLKLTKYKILGRLVKGDRTDYLLGNEKDPNNPVAKMEVSGILNATTNNSVNKRVGIKKRQVNKINNRAYPVYIAIIEFGKPAAKFIIVWIKKLKCYMIRLWNLMIWEN